MARTKLKKILIEGTIKVPENEDVEDVERTIRGILRLKYADFEGIIGDYDAIMDDRKAKLEKSIEIANKKLWCAINGVDSSGWAKL